MNLIVNFKAVGKSPTTLDFAIGDCPQAVEQEIRGYLKQELTEGKDIDNVTMSTKNLGKLEMGLVNAMVKLIKKHSNKDDELVNVSLSIKTE